MADVPLRRAHSLHPRARAALGHDVQACQRATMGHGELQPHFSSRTNFVRAKSRCTLERLGMPDGSGMHRVGVRPPPPARARHPSPTSLHNPPKGSPPGPAVSDPSHLILRAPVPSPPDSSSLLHADHSPCVTCRRPLLRRWKALLQLFLMPYQRVSGGHAVASGWSARGS